MNDTYENLDWIHPDLKSYRYEHEEADYSNDDQEYIHMYYVDPDSPEILIFATTRAVKHDVVDGYYIAHPVYENGWIMLMYSICSEDFCYFRYGDNQGHSIDLYYVELQASKDHKLFCLGWDFKTGKKDPTEYLFNEDPSIRDVAKEFISSKENQSNV